MLLKENEALTSPFLPLLFHICVFGVLCVLVVCVSRGFSFLCVSVEFLCGGLGEGGEGGEGEKSCPYACCGYMFSFFRRQLYTILIDIAREREMLT